MKPTKQYLAVGSKDIHIDRAVCEVRKIFLKQGYVWSDHYSLEKSGDALQTGNAGYTISDLEQEVIFKTHSLEDCAAQLAVLEGPGNLVTQLQNTQDEFDIDVELDEIEDCGDNTFEIITEPMAQFQELMPKR